MSFPPEIYLIGAQKSGTTTLAYLLEQHPKVSIASYKEPLFFTHNWKKGINWYQKQFPSWEQTVCIDASPSYSAAPLVPEDRRHIYVGVPKKAYSLNPNAKIIYIMRNPVERTYSGFWAGRRHGEEKREFRDAALDSACNYADISDYAGQLSLWFEYYPRNSFLFLLFEDLKEHPEMLAKKCFDFMGINSSISVHMDSVQNKSYNVGFVGSEINKLTLKYPGLHKLKILMPQFSRDFIKQLKKGSQPIPRMEDADREWLQEHFKEKNKRLEEMTGLSLEKWK